MDQEPPRQTRDGSEPDVDVETVEGSEVFSVDSSSRPEGRSDVAVSDSPPLASLLGDLQVVTQPQWGVPSTHPPVGFHTAEVSRPSPQLPPLLQQVSPVRTSSRNTPPPLKRRGAAAAAAGGGPGSASRGGGCLGRGDGSFSPPGLQPAASASNGPPAQSPAERRKQRCSPAADTPPGGPGSPEVNHRVLDDAPSEGGPGRQPSPVEGGAPAQLCPTAGSTNGGCLYSGRSSHIPSSTSAGAAVGDDAPSSAPEEPSAHLQPPPWRCGVGGAAPPLVPHTAFSSEDSSLPTGAHSDLLDSQEWQPPVGSL